MDFLDIVVKITWSILPITIAVTVVQYRKVTGHKEILEIVVSKANSYIYWIEEEFPKLNKDEKVSMIKSIITDELQGMGYNTYKKQECMEREILAAFKKRDMTFNPFNTEPDLEAHKDN